MIVVKILKVDARYKINSHHSKIKDELATDLNDVFFHAVLTYPVLAQVDLSQVGQASAQKC